MLNLEKPVNLSLLVMAGAFVASLGTLYLAHPSWIQRQEKGTGDAVISWPIAIAYALTFSLVCAVATLLLATSRRGPVETKAIPEANFPSSMVIEDFCRHNFS